MCSVTGCSDLEPRVHFYEIEVAVLIAELNGADAEIAELRLSPSVTTLPISYRGFGDEVQATGFFPDLLMSALQRAIAFAQMQDLAVGISKHLRADMPRRF